MGLKNLENNLKVVDKNLDSGKKWYNGIKN